MGYKADDYRISKKNPRDKLRADADLDFGIYVGEVIVTPKDQSHSGRIPVYIPMLSKDRNDPKGYFNCYWSSPFAGTTPSAKVGPQAEKYQDTMKTYGMWMVPPDPGNFVLVIFGDGKKKNPIIIGCMFPDQMQNMVPGNPAGATFGTEIPMPTAEKNRLAGPKSHGKEVPRPLNPYIAYPIVKQGLINDPVRGTTTSGARRESPSQVFGFLTPGPMDVNVDTGKMDGTNRLGGHSFVLDDSLEQRHIRLRTAGGAQLLLDDTNEIVYVINSPGTAWVELAKDGSMHVFSDEDLNMRATSNVNIRADHTLNLDAGVRVNINAGIYNPGGELDPDVDTLKLGSPTGGDVFIQAGDTINSLSSKSINMEVPTGDGIISQRTKGTIHSFTDGNQVHHAGGRTVIKSSGDTYVTSGGSGHIVSGGQSFVKGSTVHLNDGGTTGDVPPGNPITPIPYNIYLDEPMSIPVFGYDHAKPGNNNPIPTGGARQSDPLIPPDVPDAGEDAGTGSNFKDPRGTKIKVASTTTMITTREPWFNHLTEDRTVQTPNTESQDNINRDLDRRYPPASSDTGHGGPDSYVEDDGTFQAGVGFDGVTGPNLSRYVHSQYFNPDGSTKTPRTAYLMEPNFQELPNQKCETLAGGALQSKFESEGLAMCVDGIASSQHFTPDESDLFYAGEFDAIPAGEGGNTVMGYKHVLMEQEREAGCIMWGDGKNFDPTSETTMLQPAGANPISVKEVTNIVKNAGPGQDLSRYGIQKAGDVMDEFGSNDQAYVIRDNKYDNFIFVNGNQGGISKQASKSLLKNDIIQHAVGVRRVIKKPMSLGQMAALTLLHHETTPSGFASHPIVGALNGSNSSTKQNVARMLMYREGYSHNYYGSKDRLLSMLFQSPDSMMPDIEAIMQRQMDWHFKTGEIAVLHALLKGL